MIETDGPRKSWLAEEVGKKEEETQATHAYSKVLLLNACSILWRNHARARKNRTRTRADKQNPVTARRRPFLCGQRNGFSAACGDSFSTIDPPDLKGITSLLLAAFRLEARARTWPRFWW